MPVFLFALLLSLPMSAEMRWGVRVEFTSAGDIDDYASVAVGVRF